MTIPRNLEITASSVEEAIETGLAQLGLTKEEVEITILDEGTKGLFGLGSREALVRLTVKTTAPVEPEVPPKEEAVPAAEEESDAAEPAVSRMEADDPDQVLQTAHDIVSELLTKMKINARVTTSFIEDDDYHGQKPVLVDIHGDDLSILIGRKAETLNALQYITSLIIGKEMGRSVPLSIDVEGYRSRRQTQLKQLAGRIADQVVETNRSQALEPMPANERRIIHIALRDNPDIFTESAGDGDRRKVVIYPKK
jgi:spoIIIJ-associated protein